MWLTLARSIANPLVSIGGALIIGGAIVIGTFYASATPSVGTYVAAVEAPIQSKVASSANIVAGQNTDLSFLRSGQVVRVSVNVGSQVTAGQTLVELNHADLDAALAQANANVAAQQAKLASLQSGTRPEQLSINQTAVSQAQSALRDAVRSAYVSADDAVHNKADQFFTNARTPSASLAMTIPDLALTNQLQQERIALEPVLTKWSAQVNASTFSTDDPTASAKNAEAYLRQTATFLDDANHALTEAQSSGAIAPSTISGYITSVNTARVTLSASLSTLTSDETAVASSQGSLTLAQAGASSDDVKAAQAAVQSAAAAAQSIEVQISQTILKAPIAGLVTAQNAHVGQTVSPGVPLISLTAEGNAKANALVVPSSSVYQDGNVYFVYVKSGNSPIRTTVQVGIVGATTTEIVSGLTAGQEVLAFDTN